MLLIGLISVAGALRGQTIVNDAVDGIAKKLAEKAMNELLNNLPTDVRIEKKVALSDSFQLPLNQRANYTLACDSIVLSGFPKMRFSIDSLTRTTTSAQGNISIRARQLSLSSGLRGAFCVDKHCVQDVRGTSVHFGLLVKARIDVGIKSILGMPVLVEHFCLGPIVQTEVANISVSGLGGLFDTVAAEAVRAIFGVLKEPITNELEMVIEKLQPSCSFLRRSSTAAF